MKPHDNRTNISQAGRARSRRPRQGAGSRSRSPIPVRPTRLPRQFPLARTGIIEPVLVGPRRRIEACASALKISLEGFRLVEAEDDPIVSSRAAVALVGAGEASALMKGSQHTDELLGAVVSRDANLRTSRRMSHVFWFDLPAYHKPLMVTDAVVNMSPSLKDKVDILANAIGFRACHRARLAQDRAVVGDRDRQSGSCLEHGRGGAFKDGRSRPDRRRGDRRPAGVRQRDFGGIGGDQGNFFAGRRRAGHPDGARISMSETCSTNRSSIWARGECAGVVLGARVPIILTSRSDSRRARIASCALAQLSLP